MIIARYLTREILNTLVAVTLVLILTLLCQQFVRYLNYVAVGKIPTNILLQLVSFEIPYLLALLLPFGLYLGILLAYGRLYANHEMTILQMCGFGSGRLMRLTIFFALIVSATVLVLMLWINPWISTKRQQIMSNDQATLHLIQTLIPGRFQVSPDGLHVMFVEKLSRDHERANNIFLAQRKKTADQTAAQHVWTLVLANQGYQIKNPELQEQFFVTTDGYRYEGMPGQSNYNITQFKKYWVRIPPNNIRATHEEDETLSTFQLWQEYQNPKRAAELQWRFSVAISTFLLAMLAVPLSAVRPRQGRYLIFLPAIITYVIYINLLFIARHWVAQSMIPIIIGMWWVHAIMLLPILIFLLIGLKNHAGRRVG